MKMRLYKKKRQIICPNRIFEKEKGRKFIYLLGKTLGPRYNNKKIFKGVGSP
jgi:hypothetical protein